MRSFNGCLSANGAAIGQEYTDTRPQAYLRRRFYSVSSKHWPEALAVLWGGGLTPHIKKVLWTV